PPAAAGGLPSTRATAPMLYIGRPLTAGPSRTHSLCPSRPPPSASTISSECKHRTAFGASKFVTSWLNCSEVPRFLGRGTARSGLDGRASQGPAEAVCRTRRINGSATRRAAPRRAGAGSGLGATPRLRPAARPRPPPTHPPPAYDYPMPTRPNPSSLALAAWHGAPMALTAMPSGCHPTTRSAEMPVEGGTTQHTPGATLATEFRDCDGPVHKDTAGSP